MTRLARLEGHRFVGDRRTMVVYDCDDVDQSAALQVMVKEDNLIGALLVQTFGPDTLEEARNRGFKAVASLGSS